MQIRNCVKEYRKLFGYTQSELACLIDFTQVGICRIEKGIFLPSLSTALRLAEVFHCSVHDLFYIVR